LRVALNAQLFSGSGAGGIESVVIALVRALGELEGPEEYVLITGPEEPDWLRPYLGPNQRVVVAPRVREEHSGVEAVKRMLGPLRPIASRLWRSVRSAPTLRWPTLSASHGFIESLDCRVVHFPYQCYITSGIPAVYNPHDLQHLHFPQFFTQTDVAQREAVYRTACREARRVVAASTWVKEDLVRQFDLAADKVMVIPWAPPTVAYGEPTEETLRAVTAAIALERPFALYPAMLWEHKNHLRLLEAVALLRDRDGLIVPLVCTGSRNTGHWPKVEARLHELRLEQQVQFPGLMPTHRLRAIYRLAQFVVIPTLFEASSLPVFEAWQEGVAVACSKVTSLPEQVAGAALLFDPLDIGAIADAIRRLFLDDELRTDLVTRGRRRLADFSWERTARTYRAVYRAAARAELNDEDREILNQ
jgi:glycosyltransferase involved in cell wall biosynthesis